MTTLNIQRGREGKKWVGLNYKEKEDAKEANGGVMPYTPSLVTTDFPGKSEWSVVNLPDILFYIHPPFSSYQNAGVQKLIEHGEYVQSDGPKPRAIRDFEILPRNISLDVPGWLVEAWRRIDTRISYRDILDRQQEDPILGLKKHTKNALQNHCRRECRKVLNTWIQYGRRPEPHRTEVESIEGLSSENIQLNTTLNRCATMPDRLVKVRLERRHEDGLYYAVPLEVTPSNWKETTFPLNHFLHNGAITQMTPAMHAAFEMYLVLMERAKVHSLEHWSKLGRKCLPVSWYDRTKVKSKPNKGYDGGCKTCTWTVDRPIHTPKFIKVEPKLFNSQAKTGKRRRQAQPSSGEEWTWGDTPHGPKKRLTTRIQLQQESESVTSTRDDSTQSSSVVYEYEESYRVEPGTKETYLTDGNGELLSEQGGKILVADCIEEEISSPASGNGYHDVGDLQHEEGGEEEDEDVSTQTKQASTAADNDDNDEIVREVELDDPFLPRDLTQAEHYPMHHHRSGYERISNPTFPVTGGGVAINDYANIGLPLLAGIGALHDDVPEAWPQSLDPSFRETMGSTATKYALGQTPNYVQAGGLLYHQSGQFGNLNYDTSFTSASTQLGTSFSSNGVETLTTASFGEGHQIPSFETQEVLLRTQPLDYCGLPTPTMTSFPQSSDVSSKAQTYPVSGSNSYPSPPGMHTYQDQMPWASSPPRRPEQEYQSTLSYASSPGPRLQNDNDMSLDLPSNGTIPSMHGQENEEYTDFEDSSFFNEAIDFT